MSDTLHLALLDLRLKHTLQRKLHELFNLEIERIRLEMESEDEVNKSKLDEIRDAAKHVERQLSYLVREITNLKDSADEILSEIETLTGDLDNDDLENEEEDEKDEDKG